MNPVLTPAHHRLLYLLAAVAQGLGLPVIQPFLIRLLDAEQWGRISLSLSLISVGLVALSAGLPQAISTLYFDAVRGPEKARAINAFGSWLSVALTILVAGGTGIWWWFNGSWEGNSPYLISILIIGMHGVTQMSLAFLRSAQRAFAFVVITIIATVSGHVIGLIAVLSLDRSASTYMAAFAIAVALASASSLMLTRPARPFGFPESLRQAIAAALPVLPHSLALVLMLQGEAFLINMAQGEAVAGRYNAVMPLALGALAVIMALSNVWQTTIFSHRGVDRGGEVRKVQQEAAGVGVLLAFGGGGVAVQALLVIAPGIDDSLLRLGRLLPLLGYGYIMFLMAAFQLFAIGRTWSMSVITPVVMFLTLGVASIPARSGDLFQVGLVQVVSYLLLGCVYCLYVWWMNASLIDLGLLFRGLVMALIVSLVMVLLPTDFGTAVVSSGLVIAVSMVAVVLYYRRLRASSAGR